MNPKGQNKAQQQNKAQENHVQILWDILYIISLWSQFITGYALYLWNTADSLYLLWIIFII